MTGPRPAGRLLLAAAVAGGLLAAVLVWRVGSATTPEPRTTESERATPETLAGQIERVAEIVARVRELAWDRVPEATVLPPDEVAGRIAAQFDEYTAEEADVDARLLTLLGAVPPGIDLRSALSDAYSERVVGFYESDTGELVVRATTGGDRLDRLGEATLAHELDHALVDQVHGLDDMDDSVSQGEDEALAELALVEGDAVVTMQRYVEVGFTAVDRLLLAQEALALGPGVADTGLPPYLQGVLEFPYTHGAAFVGALIDDGGWAAVDAAYDAPPATTAQILFPERYLAGEGPEPVDIGAEGEGAAWTELGVLDVGAADLLLLFEAPGGDSAAALDDPLGRAGDWRGGSVRVSADGGRSMITMVLAGDDGLCGSMVAWYAAAFPRSRVDEAHGRTTFDGSSQDASVECSGERTTVTISQ